MTTTYVMNGQSASTSNPADAPDYGGMYPYTNSPTPMLGFNGRWATALVQLHYSTDYALTAGALSGLPLNLVSNTNGEMFSGGSGPVNKTNLSLVDAGIAAGTGVTMSINMNGLTPHVVGVYSGSAPEVSYDKVSGILTVTSTTTPDNLVNAAGESLSSAFGVMVATDIGITLPDPTQPLGIIAQTEHWVGDMFPLMPGFDSNSAIPNNGGTLGTATARCGSTIYGPKGETRHVNLFISDATIPFMFGSNATSASDLKAVIGDAANGEVEAGVSVTPATNFSTSGVAVSFPYTFASPKDLTLSAASAVLADPVPPSETSPTTSSSSGGGGVTFLLLPILALLWLPLARRRG